MGSVFKKLPASKHNIDLGLLFAVTLCSCISTILIWSIVKSGISENEGVGNSYWQTQLISMGLGIAAAYIISCIDYRKLVKVWWHCRSRRWATSARARTIRAGYVYSV